MTADQNLTKMQTEDEQIIAVDSTDTPLHAIGKFEAHRNPGTLHRAVTVVLFNENHEMLVTQRSAQKPLWPLWWDAACSTHQWWPAEDDVVCAKRRLPFELGINLDEISDLQFAFQYEYHAVYSPEWAENEINHIVIGHTSTPIAINPHPREVAQYAWKTVAQIQEELSNPHHKYAPWFPYIIEKIARSVPHASFEE